MFIELSKMDQENELGRIFDRAGLGENWCVPPDLLLRLLGVIGTSRATPRGKPRDIAYRGSTHVASSPFSVFFPVHGVSLRAVVISFLFPYTADISLKAVFIRGWAQMK